MLAFFAQPWPWWIAGPMISLVMILLWWSGQSFGVSGTLRTMCTLGGGKRWASFFDYDWRQDRWNLLFVGGAVIGGGIAGHVIPNPDPMILAAETVQDLQALQVNTDLRYLAPQDLFGQESLRSPGHLLLLIGGGVCIGFGTRYAGGCTSGHAITGLSHLQWPSLVAVIGFFAGGLLCTYLLLPLLLS